MKGPDAVNAYTRETLGILDNVREPGALAAELHRVGDEPVGDRVDRLPLRGGRVEVDHREAQFE